MDIKEEILSDNDEDPVVTEIMSRDQDDNPDLLPQKSRKLYEKSYNEFNQWINENKIDCFTTKNAVVDAMIKYVDEILRSTKGPATIISQLSKIKTTIRHYHNIDIGDNKKIQKMCKELLNEYKDKGRLDKKKFTLNDIERFLREAPDVRFLAMKACLIIGVTGECKTNDLRSMTLDDLQDDGTAYKFEIERSIGKNTPRFVTGESYEIIKKYISSRPKNCPTNTLFLNYQRGYCGSQAIGRHEFGKIPKKIAKFLNLPDSELFCASAFRLTGTSLLIEFQKEATEQGTPSSSLSFLHNPHELVTYKAKTRDNSRCNLVPIVPEEPQINVTSSALEKNISTPICIDEPEQQSTMLTLNPCTSNTLEEDTPAPLLFEEPEQPVTKKRKIPDTTSLTFNQCTSDDNSNLPQPTKVRVVRIEKLKNNVKDNLSSSPSLTFNKSILNKKQNPQPSGKLRVVSLPKLKTYSRGNSLPSTLKKPNANVSQNLEPSAKIITSNGGSMSIQLNNCSNMKIYIVKE